MVETSDTCELSVEWLYATTELPSSIVDMAFSSLLELGRRGTGQHLMARAVEMTRPDPGVSAHAHYFGCPVRYAAPRNALVLHRVDLDLPFLSHNPELLGMLLPVLDAALEERKSQGSTSSQIKAALKRALPSGRPEIAAVARQLGVSHRTLQRRITSEGSSFRQLLLEARQELARQYLARPDAEIGDVAFTLGYEDANSFYRAFRSWEGITPAQWRELKVNGGAFQDHIP